MGPADRAVLAAIQVPNGFRAIEATQSAEDREYNRALASVTKITMPTKVSLPTFIPISEVEAEPIRWLWRNRIALGKTCLIGGDPGSGKSFLMLKVAAEIARGGILPDDEQVHQGREVLIVNLEDGNADTIRPRLDTFSLTKDQLARIFVIKEGGSFNLTMISVLDKFMDEHPKTALVVLDPLAAIVGGKVDANRANQVREVMVPLKTFAERRGVAVVIVAHLNKAEAQKVLYRVAGSGDFVAAVRTAFIVGTDPEDKSRHALAHIKNNLSKAPDSVGFRIDDAGVHWTEAGDLDAVTMLTATTKTDDRNRPGRIAEAFIREMLANGPVESKEMERRAADDRIASATLNRAKERIGAKSVRIGGTGPSGYWAWELSK